MRLILDIFLFFIVFFVAVGSALRAIFWAGQNFSGSAPMIFGLGTIAAAGFVLSRFTKILSDNIEAREAKKVQESRKN